MTMLDLETLNLFADAPAYERFMGRHSRRIAPLFVDFAGLGNAQNILDVGSGTGALSSTIAARDGQRSVTGVDACTAYVAYATAAAGNDRVSFTVGDACRLQFEADSFDAAVSLLVFNFISDPAQALAEVRRVVRAGGVIAAAVWDYGEGMEMLRIFWDAAVALDPAAARRDEGLMPLCRSGELGALARSAGLTGVEERGLEAEVSFESFDDYWSPFTQGQGPAGAYVEGLEAGHVEQLRLEVARRLPPAPFTLLLRAWAMRGIN